MRLLPDNMPSDDIARDLRGAILTGDHAEASRLAEQYQRALAGEWQGMSQRERAASDLPRRSRELLTWATGVARMQHTMAGQHLAALGMAQQYLKARANYAQLSTD